MWNRSPTEIWPGFRWARGTDRAGARFNGTKCANGRCPSADRSPAEHLKRARAEKASGSNSLRRFGLSDAGFLLLSCRPNFLCHSLPPPSLRDQFRDLVLYATLELLRFFRQIDLHGNVSDLKKRPGHRVVRMVGKPLKYRIQMPYSAAPFMYGRGKRRGMLEHQLAHVLARDIDELRHVTQADKIRCDFEELRRWNRLSRILDGTRDRAHR